MELLISLLIVGSVFLVGSLAFLCYWVLDYCEFRRDFVGINVAGNSTESPASYSILGRMKRDYVHLLTRIEVLEKDKRPKCKKCGKAL